MAVVAWHLHHKKVLSLKISDKEDFIEVCSAGRFYSRLNGSVAWMCSYIYCTMLMQDDIGKTESFSHFFFEEKMGVLGQ